MLKKNGTSTPDAFAAIVKGKLIKGKKKAPKKAGR